MLLGLLKKTQPIQNLLKKYLKISGFLVGNLVVLQIIATFILFTSICTYGIFYYFYIPPSEIQHPVYFDYAPEKGDLPILELDLLNNPKIKNKAHWHRVLRSGVKYTFSLDLIVPDSPRNQNAGVWMIETSVLNGNIVTGSSKIPVILTYRSKGIRSVRSIIYGVPLIAGAMKESQHIPVDLLSNFREPKNTPTTGIRVQISNKEIEIYSAQLNINSNFTGLRYFCRYWFFTSAIIIVSLLFIFQFSIALIIYIVLLVMFTKHKLSNNNQNKLWNNKIKKNKTQNLNFLKTKINPLNLLRKGDTKNANIEKELAKEKNAQDFDSFGGKKMIVWIMLNEESVENKAQLEINHKKIVIRMKMTNILVKGSIGLKSKDWSFTSEIDMAFWYTIESIIRYLFGLKRKKRQGLA
ncbi:hypothetical protein M0813_19242 [Anaeramoeba flamelloides]|uniref:Uncharacterized protein n=1 Tax=Anaeramoeba flamelloides TaxID=1746091 RepID=A0ABQ8YPQ5_9EUKA|nr:hypothetical protein M0813_19242 [Anaeramoeba flamelloides]